MELDTATGGNQLSQPDLQESSLQFQSATKHVLPVLGTFVAQTSLDVERNALPIVYTVTKVPNFNLLGRSAISTLQISIIKYLFSRSVVPVLFNLADQ